MTLRDASLLNYLQRLKNYVRDNNSNKPVMVTYTTLLSKSLKAKFTLRRYWIHMVNVGLSNKKFRSSYSPPICWSIEESEKSVHVHALYDGFQALRTHQTIWNTIHLHDVGRAYVSTGEDWGIYIDYIHKSFARINKFFGHFVIFGTNPLIGAARQ